jgi:2,3-dimethylmalate lyase
VRAGNYVEVVPIDQALHATAAVDMKNELDPNFVVMAQCSARDASNGTLEDPIARMRAYNEEAGADRVGCQSDWHGYQVKVRAD